MWPDLMFLIVPWQLLRDSAGCMEMHKHSPSHYFCLEFKITWETINFLPKILTEKCISEVRINYLFMYRFEKEVLSTLRLNFKESKRFCTCFSPAFTGLEQETVKNHFREKAEITIGALTVSASKKTPKHCKHLHVESGFAFLFGVALVKIVFSTLSLCTHPLVDTRHNYSEFTLFCWPMTCFLLCRYFDLYLT